jgi:phage terminase large subunit-like protein
MRSPNRLDWLVWALTELMLGDAPGTNILEWMRQEVATKERKAAG